MEEHDSELLYTITKQQNETQRFLGRIEASLESIQSQYVQINESTKSSFDTLNKRISDTNAMINTSLHELKVEREHQYELIKEHGERLDVIEKEREHNKGLIHMAKIIFGVLGTAITAVIGFLINVFLRSGGGN